MFSAFGGRKLFLALLAIVLVGAREFFELDPEVVEGIVVIALGGIGGIAVEDGLAKVGSKGVEKQ